MKNFLRIVLISLLLCGNAFAKTKFSEVKKALKEDGYGKAIPEKFHHLNSPKAINPVSVSDFSILGEKSIRFESNDGECGKEPKWNDCTNDRERAELYYKKKPWKKERWYRFYVHLPKDYNSIAPAKMSLIQWKRHKPSKVLVMFQHDHSGLTFNRNGDTFKDTYIVLKPNKDLLGSWTEIIFSTNWHLDPEKGFMKVWIDGKLKVDFKGRSNSKKGKELSLRYGLYSSSISRYKRVFETETMPQRIVFFDGVKEEKNCEKLLDETKCQSLKSQTINEYDVFMYSKYNKKLSPNSIYKMSPSQFSALWGK
tara:strand:- start:310 stop:1239 length:930 start_codon:yes stop_codon:yes gene_type:complete